MLFGNFKEAKREADWTVRLPEDDPRALRCLLYIIHGYATQVPDSGSLNEI